MAFTRIKRFQKGGRWYEYTVRQASVRVGKKVKSIYLGRADEVAHVPALLEDKANEDFLAKEKTSTEVKATPAEAEQPLGQDSEAETSPPSGQAP